MWDCDRDANAGVMRCPGLLRDVTPAPKALSQRSPDSRHLGHQAGRAADEDGLEWLAQGLPLRCKFEPGVSGEFAASGRHDRLLEAGLAHCQPLLDIQPNAGPSIRPLSAHLLVICILSRSPPYKTSASIKCFRNVSPSTKSKLSLSRWRFLLNVALLESKTRPSLHSH